MENKEVEFKPEEVSEILIWDWLKNKGQNVKEVYFNRENKLGWKKFRVEGSQKKPDFIIECYYQDKLFYVAVEVKSINNSRDILSASKIIDVYCKNYEDKITKYFIENKEIIIDSFLIATENSRIGYLFETENLLDNLSDTQSTSKHYVTKLGLIPRYEGNRTFEFVRTLWNQYSKIRTKTSPAIGILIANLEKNNSPYQMITKFDQIKNRWSQRFIAI